MFKWMMNGSKTIAQVDVEYKEQLEKHYHVSNMDKKTSVNFLLKFYFMLQIVMAVFVSVVIVKMKHWASIKSIGLREYFKDLNARWNWFAFWLFTISSTVFGYIWGWRHLLLDVETKKLFGADVIPAWLFFTQTTILKKEFGGFVVEDWIFYPLGFAFGYLLYKMFGVDKIQSSDFKYKKQIGASFFMAIFAFCFFCFSFVDYSSRIGFESFVLPFGFIFFFVVKYLNIKRALIFSFFINVSGFLYGWTSLIMFPWIGSLLGIDLNHLVMWYFNIGDVHSVLFNPNDIFWLFEKEPFSANIFCVLIGNFWMLILIPLIENVLCKDNNK